MADPHGGEEEEGVPGMADVAGIPLEMVKVSGQGEFECSSAPLEETKAGHVSTLVTLYDRKKTEFQVNHVEASDAAGDFDRFESQPLQLEQHESMMNDKIEAAEDETHLDLHQNKKLLHGIGDISFQLDPKTFMHVLHAVTQSEIAQPSPPKKSSYTLPNRKSYPPSSSSSLPRSYPYKYRPIHLSFQAKRIASRHTSKPYPESRLSFPLATAFPKLTTENPTFPLDTPMQEPKSSSSHSSVQPLSSMADLVKGGNAQPSISMADIVKGGQNPPGPKILDASRIKQRGSSSQEDGIPCLHIPDTDNLELAGRMGLALIGKFSHSIPAPHLIRKALSNLVLKGTLKWNFINAKHILITLSDMDDYVKILSGAYNNNSVWFVEHHPMRMFKWTPDFDLFFETPITAVWCNLHALPIHLFDESMLFSIGKLFGEPIQIDHNTATRSRLSYARICIEIDISKPPPEKYILRIGGKDVVLQVKWDPIPKYCSACKHVGHVEDHCYAFGKRPAPPKRDFSRPAPQRQSGSRGDQGGQPQRPGPQRQNEGGRMQGGQPRGTGGQDVGRGQGNQPRVDQNMGQADLEGWNRVGRKGSITKEPALQTREKGKQATRFEDMGKDLQRIQSQITTGRVEHIPSGSLQIRDPVLVSRSSMIDHHTPLMGEKKKRRSPESRARYRERRRLRRLKEMEGLAETETEGSEFETDDGGEVQRAGSLSPTFRESRTSGLENSMGLDVHSNRFDILEDEDPVNDGSDMAMVLHDGTADAQIIHDARMAKGVRNGAASNGSSPMEIASNGDHRPAIEAPGKKARVSTSRPT